MEGEAPKVEVERHVRERETETGMQEMQREARETQRKTWNPS